MPSPRRRPTPTPDPAPPARSRMLAGSRVVLGVTGGIAAYKAVEVCRRLVDGGAHVSPVMTAGATRFLGATTLSALASEPVRTSLWDEAEPIPHTRLAAAVGVPREEVTVDPSADFPSDEFDADVGEGDE